MSQTQAWHFLAWLGDGHTLNFTSIVNGLDLTGGTGKSSRQGRGGKKEIAAGRPLHSAHSYGVALLDSELRWRNVDAFGHFRILIFWNYKLDLLSTFVSKFCVLKRL
ncbi:hypothetical protein MRB53_026689 [Persea americana]|uniref:Uncharacterized protein n=1 Tax=Persea americana TaxID=3435 RepID=A0ACC2LJ25_PERAE|nr:hypothetical protein MRB53_026689 [Persea americana]